MVQGPDYPVSFSADLRPVAGTGSGSINSSLLALGPFRRKPTICCFFGLLIDFLV
jgi:hypothetical protein